MDYLRSKIGRIGSKGVVNDTASNGEKYLLVETDRRRKSPEDIPRVYFPKGKLLILICFRFCFRLSPSIERHASPWTRRDWEYSMWREDKQILSIAGHAYRDVVPSLSPPWGDKTSAL